MSPLETVPVADLDIHQPPWMKSQFPAIPPVPSPPLRNEKEFDKIMRVFRRLLALLNMRFRDVVLSKATDQPLITKS